MTKFHFSTSFIFAALTASLLPSDSNALRIAADSTGFKNFLQNFGDESQFWWILGFWYRLQILKKFVTRVRPYWDQFWKILTIEFC